jgi:hypothetical protein
MRRHCGRPLAPQKRCPLSPLQRGE